MTEPTTSGPTTSGPTPAGSHTVLLVLSWLILVILPLLYGVVELISKLGALFT
jgi:hypothetical protein